MANSLKNIRSDDRGAAMATVALLGTALVLLAAVVVTASMQSYQRTDSDRGWEESIVVAESGVDEVLYELNLDRDYMADNGLEVAAGTDLSTKDAVIQQAEAVADTKVIDTPDGEVVVLKPEGEYKVYAVGFSPNRADPRRQERVMAVEYEPDLLVTTNSPVPLAFVSGGDLDASASSAGVRDGRGKSEAHVHANGKLDLHPGFKLDGCGTGIGNGVGNGVNCPSPAIEIPLPAVDPRTAYGLSQFDLCPNGLIRSGPAHPATPNPSDEPCTGAPAALPGWNNSMQQGVRQWKPGPSAAGGVIYVHHGNVDGKLAGSSGPLAITLIVSSVDETGTCASNSGHIVLSGGSDIVPHPSAGDLALAAGGDIRMTGGASIQGLTMAHEQVYFSGGTRAGGAVLAESACHHPSSPVDVSTITGGTDLLYDGTLLSPFTTTVDTGQINFVRSTEL